MNADEGSVYETAGGGPPPELDSSRKPLGEDAFTVFRSVTVGAKHEDISVINCREIEDWCHECQKHRHGIVSVTSGLGLALGLLAGFLPALVSTNGDQKPGWWAVFALGTAFSVVAVVGLGIAFLFMRATPVRGWGRKKGWVKNEDSPLSELARRMERAKDLNRFPQQKEGQG